MTTSFPVLHPWIFSYGDLLKIKCLPAVVELRTQITAAVAEVTPEMLRSVWQGNDYRWDVTLNRNCPRKNSVCFPTL
jgi:hypothetical protein